MAFWLETAGGDRIGYGPLASYAAGVGERRPGRRRPAAGRVGGSLRVAWQRAGTSIDPFPILQATRPSAG